MTSTARKFDIVIEQGATFTLDLTYKDSLGAPVNLSGYDAYMQVRTKSGGAILATATVANGRIVTNSSGRVLVTISRQETSAMRVDFGAYDLFIRNPIDDTATKLLYGDVEVISAVTQV